MLDWKFRGFVEIASEAISNADARKPREFRDIEHDFLSGGFDDARDRMTTLASTVGTAGSFLLVLVALLVGFATRTNEQADKLVAASNVAAQVAQGCSDQVTSALCDTAKAEQAREEVQRAQTRLNNFGRLNRAQSITAGFVMTAFLLGLAALLTNPVPGPDAASKAEAGVTAWMRAVDRLRTKRKWIEASLLAQLGAMVSIVYLGLDVFKG